MLLSVEFWAKEVVLNFKKEIILRNLKKILKFKFDRLALINVSFLLLKIVGSSQTTLSVKIP